MSQVRKMNWPIPVQTTAQADVDGDYDGHHQKGRTPKKAPRTIAMYRPTSIGAPSSKER